MILYLYIRAYTLMHVYIGGLNMNGNLRFEDKIVAITGASSGIGRASALAFAREGATTVLASRSEEKLERVADEIRSFNPRVFVIPTDVSVREQVQHLVDRTVREFGRIDILFNNAGNAYVGRIDEEPFADDLNKMLGVSFYGALYGTQAVLPSMKRQGAGHIVNISSLVGRKAFPHFGGYSSLCTRSAPSRTPCDKSCMAQGSL